MKNFLQILLIALSMALCGLIAFQWVRETALRKEVQALTNSVQDKSETILNHEATIRREEAEIQRLDGIKKELTERVKTNEVQIAMLMKSYDRATNELDRVQKQGEVYKEALAHANENIAKQNEDIRKQNEDMKQLAEDRNEIVNKFNKVAKDYNDLVIKWNKQQEELAKMATNTPPATASKK
jgi:chromosome segregation ATPase